ncbi:MAG: hypothetical protein ACLGI3_06455, partial [Actinomycetes bacterium]
MASSAPPARDPRGTGSPEPAQPAAGAALLSAGDVGRVVDRLAHQLIERCARDRGPGNDGAAGPTGGLADLVLVGLPT